MRIPICLVLLISVLPLSACSILRAPSLNMLKKRADYDGKRQLEESLGSVDNPLLVPSRTEPVVTDIWVHPHEMPTNDYFRGGWIRTIVSDSHWEVKPNESRLLPERKSKARKTRK